MAKKDFLARQEEMKQRYFDAGEEIGTQKTWDAVQLALRDVEPKKWGKIKIEKLYERTAYYKNYFQECFTMSPEADVKQEEQDAISAIVDKLTLYRYAIERLLGAAFGSIVLMDAEELARVCQTMLRQGGRA